MAADKPTAAFCRTLSTALLHDYEPVVVGWGRHYDYPYRSKAAKLKLVHDYLVHNASNNDLIAMVDGSDMWLQQPPSVLLARYHELAGKDRPILLGADKKCYPVKAYCRGVPESTLDPYIFGEETDKDKHHFMNRPRYVNSGNLIGYRQELLSLYSRMVDWEADPFGDQVVFSQFYQNRTHDMRLDYTAKLFLSLGYAEDDAILMPDHYGIGASHHQHQPGFLLWSRLSGSMPVSIHFPGKSKPRMFEWWPETWWGRLGSEEFRNRLATKGVRLAESKAFVPWSELCSALIDKEQTYTLNENFKEVKAPAV